MGLFATLKARKAAGLQSKGDIKGAQALYEEALAQGLDDPRMILAYSVLMIRDGQYQKAKDLLVSKQKLQMAPDQKTQLFMNYAVCCYKLGDMERGVNLLERQHHHQPTGMVYQTLGYLYVEKYDPAHKEAFAETERKKAAAAAEAAAREAVEENEAGETDGPTAVFVQPQVDVEALWQEGVEKTRAFLEEAVEYDDVDSICLDNMGQFLYRVLGEKEAAKEWFLKAINVKATQIDTLWFLSRYDLENGDKAAAVARLETAMEGRFSPLNYVTREQVEAELQTLQA